MRSCAILTVVALACGLPACGRNAPERTEPPTIAAPVTGQPNSSGNDPVLEKLFGSGQTMDQTPRQCYQPLGCGPGTQRSCGTYNEHLANLKQACQGLLEASAGVCAGYRVLRMSNGFVGGTYYFDEAGSLVASISFTDAGDGNAECPFWTHFGARIACQPDVMTSVCAELSVPTQ